MEAGSERGRPFFKINMKRLCIICCLLLTAFSSCSPHKGSLYKEATKVFPHRLEKAMAEYMGTVAAPVISDMEPIYDCDSICVLQCRASAPDASGRTLTETVRYIFVRDNLLSSRSGKPVYLDNITGARYLDKQGKKEYCDKIIANGSNQYAYFLGISEPVDSF